MRGWRGYSAHPFTWHSRESGRSRRGLENGARASPSTMPALYPCETPHRSRVWKRGEKTKKLFKRSILFFRSFMRKTRVIDKIMYSSSYHGKIRTHPSIHGRRNFAKRVQHRPSVSSRFNRMMGESAGSARACRHSGRRRLSKRFDPSRRSGMASVTQTWS